MKPYAFGVDMGGTTIKIGFFRKDGALIEKWEIPTRTENRGANLLTDIALAVLSKLAEKGIKTSDVEGIGMGVPGAVYNEGFVKPCANLNQWGGFDVATELSTLCKMSVKVVNDANAAALGEMKFGGGRGHKNVVFVTLGTGVGGGIIVDGKLVTGVHGAGGEIGHMKVKSGEVTACGCGKKGCLEQYASATGIVRNTKLYLEQSSIDSSLRQFEALTCKNIFDCAKSGDIVAVNQVDEMTHMLGKALANIACVVDPEVFVIGGGVSRAGDIIIENVKKYFTLYAFPATEDVDFTLAKLGNDAGMYGCFTVVSD
ncbi:MAG: ROK family glucokinase [Lachnospiraceae bacterium]|nr:ROK family glucokinase [Lachnospiraceae bacterium]